jgi:hypothetical protein
MVIVFLYIFGPVFRPLGNYVDLIFFTSFGLIIYSRFKGMRIVPKYLMYFTPLFVLFFYGAFLVSFKIDSNIGIIMSLLLKPLRIIITIMGGFSLAFIMLKWNSKRFNQDALRYVFIAILIHAIIMLIQFNNPVFKDWIYSFTFRGEFRSSFDYNFRMGGLSGGSGGAVLSVVQSLGVLIIPFLWKHCKGSFKIILVIAGIMIFASVLVCGRSGLWAIIFGLPLSFLWLNGFSYSKTLIKIPFLIILFSGLYFLLLSYYGTIDKDTNIYLSLGRTLDIFINYFKGGDFHSPTVTVLKSHILFPTDIKNFLMGDGEHLLGKQFDMELTSDIGYVKNLWSFGFFGLMIYVIPLVALYRFVLKYISTISISKPLLFFIFIMFVFHAKESFLYVRMYLSIISLLLGVFYIEKVKIVQKHNILYSPK